MKVLNDALDKGVLTPDCIVNILAFSDTTEREKVIFRKLYNLLKDNPHPILLSRDKLPEYIKYWCTEKYENLPDWFVKCVDWQKVTDERIGDYIPFRIEGRNEDFYIFDKKLDNIYKRR